MRRIMLGATDNPLRVLVTGAAGAIGRYACRGLVERGHWVRGMDLVEADLPGVAEFQCGNISDADAVDQAVDGVDQVIHLAANPGWGAFREELVEPNILGAYEIFRACEAASIQRLVTVSTCQVVAGHDYANTLVSTDAPMAPSGHYAATKVFMETLAELYVRMHGMCILVVRPGWLPCDEAVLEQIGASARTRNIYLSHEDAARFFVAAVEADLPAPGLATVFAQSRGENDDVGLDRRPAEELLGYRPRDIWPEGFHPPAAPGA